MTPEYFFRVFRPLLLVLDELPQDSAEAPFPVDVIGPRAPPLQTSIDRRQRGIRSDDRISRPAGSALFQPVEDRPSRRDGRPGIVRLASGARQSGKPDWRRGIAVGFP